MSEVVSYDAKEVMNKLIADFVKVYKNMSINAKIINVTHDMEGKYLGCEVFVSPKDKRIFPITLITRYGIIKARSHSGERVVYNAPKEMIEWFDSIAQEDTNLCLMKTTI